MATKNRKYYKGNLQRDSLRGNHHGWVMGVFMEKGSRKTSKMEVKYWAFPNGATTHVTKVSGTVEFSYVLSGSMSGQVDGKKIHLKAGEYIIIQPGVKNNISERSFGKSAGITIKAPSDPKAKAIAS